MKKNTVSILDFEKAGFNMEDIFKYSNKLNYMKENTINTSFITNTCHTPLNSVFGSPLCTLLFHRSFWKWECYHPGSPQLGVFSLDSSPQQFLSTKHSVSRQSLSSPAYFQP